MNGNTVKQLLVTFVFSGYLQGAFASEQSALFEASRLMQANQLEAAKGVFQSVLNSESELPTITQAKIYNDLGTIALVQEDSKQAITLFKQALEQLDHSNTEPHLYQKILLNRANARLQDAYYDQLDPPIESLFQDAKASLSPGRATESKSQVVLTLQWSRLLSKLIAAWPNADPTSYQDIRRFQFEKLQALFTETYQFQSKAPLNEHQKRIKLQLLLQLALLYEAETQYQDASLLTEEALKLVAEMQEPFTQFRLQWLQARIALQTSSSQLSQGLMQRAIDSFEQNPPVALNLFENDLTSAEYPVSKLYRSQVTLLVDKLKNSDKPSDAQVLLAGIRQLIEASKAQDLQDYFGEECVSNARSVADPQLAEQDATLYPMVLDEGIFVLLQHNRRFHWAYTALEPETLALTLAGYHKELQRRRTRAFQTPSQKLYQWLIAPVLTEELVSSIQTLTVVPDTPLLGLPFGSLYDGEKFLVERLPLAMAPAADLVDNSSKQAEDQSVLFSGMIEASQGFPALPYVENELEQIRSTHTGTTLLNRDFTLANFESQVAGGQHRIAHVASHGVFKPRVNQSFILTHDGKMSLDQLAQLVSRSEFLGQPIDLLTLSACQTATGSEEAILGLAGITVKSGVKTALATLWSVNDRTTAALMGHFYRYLQAGESKQEALRKAQLEMIADRAYRHPGYWSPYVLIGASS